MPSIFLSHSSKDKAFVRVLAARLRDYGVEVWIDEAEINYGDSLIEKIGAAIHRTDFVAAVLSSNSVSSNWVKKELEIALQREIESKRVVLVPILRDAVEIPPFLTGKLYADFSSQEKLEEGFPRLLRTLGVRPTPHRSIEEPPTKPQHVAPSGSPEPATRATATTEDRKPPVRTMAAVNVVGTIFEDLLAYQPDTENVHSKRYAAAVERLRSAQVAAFGRHIRFANGLPDEGRIMSLGFVYAVCWAVRRSLPQDSLRIAGEIAETDMKESAPRWLIQGRLLATFTTVRAMGSSLTVHIHEFGIHWEDHRQLKGYSRTWDELAVQDFEVQHRGEDRRRCRIRIGSDVMDDVHPPLTLAETMFTRTTTADLTIDLLLAALRRAQQFGRTYRVGLRCWGEGEAEKALAESKPLWE